VPPKLFSFERLKQNLAVLAAAAPEVAYWLQAESDFSACANQAQETANEEQVSWSRGDNPLLKGALRSGGVTVVVGGGDLRAVCDLVAHMPLGHQVFVMEPRADLLCRGLGSHDLAPHLAEGDLVILAPSEMALEEALSRHPQLALAEELEVVSLSPLGGEAWAEAARARLYRMLGQAFKARDLALNWEGPSGANLIRNLYHVAFMGLAPSLAGALAGRPAFIAEAGPGLAEALPLMAGRIGKAALFCSELALPEVLAAGILPTAVVLLSPAAGRLFSLGHPWLAHLPLIAEKVAHAPTVQAHPGPRFICLGPRVSVPGALGVLGETFTPQHHALGRLVEVALSAGAKPLVLVGADLVDGQGHLILPGMDGSPVQTGLEQASTASGLGRVLARAGCHALNTSRRGLGLPGTCFAELGQLMREVGAPGQPLRVTALNQEAWLGVEELRAVAQGLNQAATGATLMWQRAAAPLHDYPRLTPQCTPSWLSSADRLFVALAEQASAEPLMAAFLDGCLVRAFRRRHRLLCQGRSQGISVEDACGELQSCLQDLESRGSELVLGLRQIAREFSELAGARASGDETILAVYARECGHQPPTL
jgi:hypothetical protein